MGSGGESDSWSDCSSKTGSCSNSDHGEQILQFLNILRKNAVFTDIVLQVEGREFPCHRAMLCANSPYFRSMFMGQLRESGQSVVQLRDVSSVALQHLLDFIYQGHVELQEDSVEMVFQAAHMLDVPLLTQACGDFLKTRVCHLNCLGLMDFAKHYSLQPLMEQCENLLHHDFDLVAKQEEFLELPLEKVIELLDSEKLKVKEEVLVETTLLWVHHQQQERKPDLVKLLERLRLPLLDPVFFTNTLEADQLVQECQDCRSLLQEARLYRMYGREISSERTKPRRQSGWAEVIVVIGGSDRRISGLSFAKKLDPTTGKWFPSPSVPGYSKYEFAACELHNDIYLSGGQLNSSDVWRFMSQLGQWVRVGSLLKGRWHHEMVSLCGKLYAVGGCDGYQRLSSVECFSVYENAWKAVAPLLLPVSLAAVASCSGKLYVISGAVTDECNNNRVQCYDPVRNKWAYMSTCPFSQRNISAVSLNSFIYVAGGLLDRLFCYDPRNDSWSKLVELPMKLESCGLTVCDGKVYIMGGQDELAAATDRTWVFDPQNGRLTEDTPLTRSLSNHCCVTITQRLQQERSVCSVHLNYLAARHVS